MYVLAEHNKKQSLCENNRDEEKGKGMERIKKETKPAHSSLSLGARQSKGVKTGTNKITNNLTHYCTFKLLWFSCYFLFRCLLVFSCLVHSIDSQR